MTLYTQSANMGFADDTSCTKDYVTIEGSTDASCSGTILRNRYCGSHLNWEGTAEEADVLVCGKWRT